MCCTQKRRTTQKKLTNQQVNCLWVMTNGFNESHYIVVVCECVAYSIIYYLADWVFSLFLKLNTKAFFILYKLLLFDCNCNEINKNRYCERELICLDRMDKHKFHYIQLKLIGLSLYTSFSVTLVCTIYFESEYWTTPNEFHCFAKHIGLTVAFAIHN